MSIVPILIVVAGVILALYFFLNKKSEEVTREGLVRTILNKDALAVDFGESNPTVVKLHGISPALEAEMLDEKIYAFLNEALQGKRVEVKPIKVEASNVVSAEVRTLSGEYVNAALARQGFARWLASEASGDSEIAEAQQQAKAEHLGVWNPAIIQLLEDRRKSGEGASDNDIANMSVDPEEEDKG